MVDCDPDCNDKGIPDACDIAACGVTEKFNASCDDCNLNSVPDGCDDPIDSISDVLLSLTGFQGVPYPFAPTAPTPCESACANPLR